MLELSFANIHTDPRRAQYVEYLHIDYSLKYVTAVQSNVIVYLTLDSSEKFSDLLPWLLFARLNKCVKSTLRFWTLFLF